MHTLYFVNKGLIPLEAITTMGISAKENDNPIGMFGTGLKYSIARILALGGRISIARGLDVYDFTTKDIEVRGKQFKQVCMNGQELGFTTDMGKHWENWMSFRELYSNMLDERGYATMEPQAVTRDTTIIKVDSDEVYEAYINKHTVFLDTPALWTSEAVNIHPGESNYIFYRGVRVAKLLKPTTYTYNIISTLTLTEDRTAKYSWECTHRIQNAICRILDNERMLNNLIYKKDDFEDSFEWDMPFSDHFLAVVAKAINNNQAFQLREKVLHRYNAVHARSKLFKPIEMTKEQAELTDWAVKTLARWGMHINCDVIMAHLDRSVFGCVYEGSIYLDPKVFDRGAHFLLSTLYEEWAHAGYHMRDESRQFQDFLLERLVKAHLKIDRLEGVPIAHI